MASKSCLRARRKINAELVFILTLVHVRNMHVVTSSLYWSCRIALHRQKSQETVQDLRRYIISIC